LNVVFFTDRDLGHQFPAILRAAGLTVERHSDEFPADCQDVVWLPAVAARGSVVLTHDGRLRYKPNELAAIIGSRATVLVLVGHAKYAELAANFVRTLPRVLSFLETHSNPPIIGKVYRPSPSEQRGNPEAPGRIELWYSKPKRP
jgi:hypothetical protein